MNDEKYMKCAIEEAQLAVATGDIPVGTVIVCGGKIIARGHNTREAVGCADGHAELTAIREASKKLGGWRLAGCTIYVTLEPCTMCAGAILESRIERVVFGAKDPTAGAFGSVLNVNSYPLGKRPSVSHGVLESECSELLRDFFAKMRAAKPQS
ncbi:MAG: nucleoside deaminase [Firmicutes bacterium]|nr:nucleoside deaminase [Bacillota bacterium]